MLPRILGFGLVLAGCGNDVGGCPIDLESALGDRCSEDGRQCGEVSLCDPCAEEDPDCVFIECIDGTWQESETSLTCPD